MIFDPRSVLVVIPALNEADHIESCLSSLDPDALEDVTVVLADGGSSDGTVEIMRAFSPPGSDVQICSNAERIQSSGVDLAVQEWARPEHRILLRCDAHAIYPAGYVARLAEKLSETGAASVVVAMDSAGRTPFARAAAWIVDTPLGSGGAAHRGGRQSGWVDHGHHAAFDLDWFRRIDGYDPSFTQNEDAEYDVRLVQAGGRIWLDAETRLTYWMREDPWALGLQYWRYGRGRARTVLKHRLVPKLRQMIPVANLVALVGGIGLGVVWPLALLVPLIYGALLVAVSLVGAWRLGAEGLWAGVVLGLMHNAWAAGFLWQIARGRGHA